MTACRVLAIGVALLMSTPVLTAAGATPFIQTLSPSAVAPGAASLTLTIYGANFSPSATVKFADQTFTPSAATRHRMLVIIPASSLSSPGTADVRVVNPPTAGLTNTSKPAQFAIVNPSANVSVGPTSVLNQFSTGHSVAADFNGDGRVDLALTDYGSSSIKIYLGDGAGHFGPPLSTDPICGYGLGTSPIAVDDFNGDGLQDIVAVCGGLYAVLLGNGRGGFSLSNQVAPTNFGNPRDLAVGDFNGDGHPDIAFVDGSSLIVLIGDGAGNFTPGPPVPAIGPAASLVTGDFNEDGNLDLVLSSFPLRVLTGDGAGHFSPGFSLALTDGGGIVRTADFNNDGHLDLVLLSGSNQPRTATVLSGNGAGQFTVTSLVSSSDFGYCVVEDFNGDGNADLAFTGPLQLQVFLGNGKGQFAQAVSIGPDTFELGTDITARDLNNDGLPDLVLNLFGKSAIRLQQPAVAPAAYNIRDVCAPATCLLSHLSNGGFAAGTDVAIYPNSPGVIAFPKTSGTTFVPFSINRFGAIAGQTLTSSDALATLWMPAPFGSQIWNLSSVDLSSTEATYVNDLNQIVADSEGARPVSGLIPGHPLSRVYAQTNNGVVLGTDPTGPLAWTQHTGIVYLRNPGGVPAVLNSAAFNQLGQVLLTAPFIGQLLTPGIGVYDLPPAPGFTVRAFNSQGQYVGVQGPPSSPVPSIYTAGGGRVPLASLITGGGGWTFNDVTAINDNSQILVLATNGPRTTTLLLTPSDHPLLPTLRSRPNAKGCITASLNAGMAFGLGCRPAVPK